MQRGPGRDLDGRGEEKRKHNTTQRKRGEEWETGGATMRSSRAGVLKSSQTGDGSTFTVRTTVALQPSWLRSPYSSSKIPAVGASTHLNQIKQCVSFHWST